MNNRTLTLISFLILLGIPAALLIRRSQAEERKLTVGGALTWIENESYPLQQPSAPGLPVLYEPQTTSAPSVVDGPDIPIYSAAGQSQSEPSLFIHPQNPLIVLNSNNSTLWPDFNVIKGADAFITVNGGGAWTGSIEGVGGPNRGDPATAIDLSGRMYVAYITSSGGMGISYSDDNGATWTARRVVTKPSLDKEHLCVDNGPASPYSRVFQCAGKRIGSGMLYDAWTNFDASDANYGDIEFTRSADGGDSWSPTINLSDALTPPLATPTGFNQGVNIQTGPEGQIYVTWAIYDEWREFFGGNEGSLGFTRSLDGGVSWSTPTRIQYINGLRQLGLNGGKTMRVNAFPSMAVNQQSGEIHIVWNEWRPADDEIDIFMISSADQGATWSSRIRVNQDVQAGAVKDQWMPWITCDPITGDLACIFYDSRNFVNNNAAETFVAVSQDHGATWTDFKVSDVPWSGNGRSTLSNYAGDYIAIASRAGRVYPAWTDSRDGSLLVYMSPFTLTSPPTSPVAEFTASPASGCAPLTVNFSSQSTGQISSWLWDFGDEGSSTIQNPSHTYTSAGTYSVTLTVTGADGADTEIKDGYIIVDNQAIASFSGSPLSGPVPLTVTLSNQTSVSGVMKWDFGDQGTSLLRDARHTYTVPGVYTISLTASNTCNMNTLTRASYINVTGTAPEWTPVQLATGVMAPVSISDGEGGVFTAYSDDAGSEANLYLQRVSALGVPWAAPILVSGGGGEQVSPALALDGQGGVILVWADSRSGDFDVYAQRVNSAGAALWTAGGVPVSTGFGRQFAPCLAPDGSGGAFVAWEDSRSGNNSIAAQRIGFNGSRAWLNSGSLDGVQICPVPEFQDFPKIVSDGASAVVTWQDQRMGTFVYSLYGQKIRSKPGDPTQMERVWGDDAVEIAEPFAIFGRYSSESIPDGSGGVIATWVNLLGGTAELYAQRLCGDGTKFWNPGGTLISGGPGDQHTASMALDEDGGAFIVWMDNRDGDFDILAQHLNSSGTAEWAPEGVVLSQASGDQLLPRIISDGSGGAMVAWQDQRAAQDVYSRRVTSNGSLLGRMNGDAVTTSGATTGVLAFAPSGPGEGIVSYLDAASGIPQLFVHRTKPVIVDRAPQVTAPATLLATEGKLLLVSMSAADPEGDEIDALSVSPLPSGATFTPNADQTEGTFRWTPTFSQAGVYDLVFTAANVQAGLANTILTIREGERLFTWGSTNQVIRLASSRPTWCLQLEAVDVSFDVTDVILTSVVLSSPGTGSVSQIPAISNKSVVVGDSDGNGLSDMQLCFWMSDLRPLFSNLAGRNTVDLELAADLYNGMRLDGKLTIDVIAAGGASAAGMVTQVGPEATVRFTTERDGPVTLRLYDVTGRLMGTILDVSWMGSGVHEVRVDGGDVNGRSLSSGVYFYRVEAVEGGEAGKILIVR